MNVGWRDPEMFSALAPQLGLLAISRRRQSLVVPGRVAVPAKDVIMTEAQRACAVRAVFGVTQHVRSEPRR